MFGCDLTISKKTKGITFVTSHASNHLEQYQKNHTYYNRMRGYCSKTQKEANQGIVKYNTIRIKRHCRTIEE